MAVEAESLNQDQPSLSKAISPLVQTHQGPHAGSKTSPDFSFQMS